MSTDLEPVRIAESPSRLGVTAALDVASVVVFVAVGRRTHEQDPGVAGLVGTAAPFLIALVVGWIVARTWWAPMSLRTGLIVWAVTITGGMLLRNLVFGDGTAMSFVIVATAFTAATLIGWRLIASLVVGRR